MALFRDRRDAGRHLARALTRFASDDLLVLGLARGGVPVAYEVARSLNADLDVFIVRKLGVPGHEELALGAIASGGVRVLNEAVVQTLAIDDATIDAIAADEERELARRDAAYRAGREHLPVRGRSAILVDDGLATGSSVRAAIKALRRRAPARIIVAVPVAPPDTCRELREEADEVVCAMTPEPFFGVGLWYEDFSQTSDDEVSTLLARAPRSPERRTSPTRAASLARERTVSIPISRGVELEGSLAVPDRARGLVIFVHGSGRHSPRNGQVAHLLNEAGLATLLMDLLTTAEERRDLESRELRFDIAFLADRVRSVVEWTQHEPELHDLPLGLFGASTGAAAALVAAAARPDLVRAVVSRGGRPDLAGDALERVTAPTLLIVGGADTSVLEVNRQALTRLLAEKGLAVVPRATHLFEEPGALDQVARLAGDWFVRWASGRDAAAERHQVT